MLYSTEFDEILDPANPLNHIPHPDVIDAQVGEQAGSDTDDETVAEPAAQINKEMNAGKMKYASLLPRINECLVKKGDCMMKTLEMFVEHQFRTVYDLIPTLDWMPGLELYGCQPENKTIVMQPPGWDDRKERTARYGDVITMPILVSHCLTHHVSVISPPSFPAE
ncbi:MAG TPA: hypothetical protein VK145_03215 [Candidatus Nanoarchaeia archaeon]|nr:hypothetical protein [Candidatus Nanoarchaeia archaeon]